MKPLSRRSNGILMRVHWSTVTGALNIPAAPFEREWKRPESVKVCPVQANVWIMRLWRDFGGFCNLRCTTYIILMSMVSFLMRLLHTSIFTTVNDTRRDLAVWHLWNSCLLESNKNRGHLLIVPAFLFSVFCLLDRGHFNSIQVAPFFNFKKGTSLLEWSVSSRPPSQGLIVIFHSPRIFSSECCEGVENTGLTGKIAFSPY